MKKTLIFALAMLVFASSVFAGGFKEHKVTVPLSFDYYYSYAMVVDALKKLHKTYPHLTKLDLVGKSEEGRDIYCLTVNNPKTGAALSKPGIYVDGNIHGNEIQAGEVALYLLNYLLTNYGVNDEITKLVDKKCFYVVPVVNVDGRYHFLAEATSARGGNRTLRRPHDDDHDGLFDEDPNDDLNGDFTINQMRKKDPNGRWKTDPEEPRLMIPVKPGEKGEWTRLGDEGIDNDGDGMVNEDGPGYVDGNRNWGFDWMPAYVQAGAGNYPLSGVGLKSLANFIMTKPNICMGWAFHNTGGMILRGPSTKAQGEFPREDVAFYDFVGEQGERIIPGYRYIIGWKDLYETYGDFMEWLVQTQGAYGYVGELFMSSQETFKSIKENKKNAHKGDDEEESFFRRDPEMEKLRLKFNDHLTQGELFNDWKPFKHPLYGDIEIGGWAKMSSRLPHPFMIKDMVHRNASAVLFSAKHTPDVSLKVFSVKKIGDNLYRVRTRLQNVAAMPSMSALASRNKVYPRDQLTLSGSGIKVVAGGPLTDVYTSKASYKEYRPELQLLTVPGFGKVEHQFLVSGQGKVTIKYQSRKAGKIVKTIELK